MPLQPGTRLGPYEVLLPLGAGGMGEVYRARDTRLGRDVAVKVLPQHAPASSDDRARLKREAKAIAQLNHPNICILHDVGHDAGVDYLVMELVEGETLAQRIAHGPLPPSDTLRFGAQIADALSRAHRAGIVHRDLKPGNVMITKSGAKLMDFGLSRGHGSTAVAAGTNTRASGGASTLEEPITTKGLVVGTLQYMAPEQLEGKQPDPRADIWALGCVLYEMGTGQRAFAGSSPATVISAILRDQPRGMAELSPLTPPAFERLVRQCLAKDPDNRWQTAGDLCRELLWIGEAGSRAGIPAHVASGRRTRERLAWSIGAAALIGVTAMLLQPRPRSKTVAFELAAPSNVKEIDRPRISPDGTLLAFNATDSTGVSRIWLRPMASTEARVLSGTEAAGRPFWSPDSRNVAYFAKGRLWKVSIEGGSPIALCVSPQGADGTWSKQGVILFDGNTIGDSIKVVSATGGSVSGATRCDPARGQAGSAWPEFLPDGKHFLFFSYGQSADSGTLKVGSIGSWKTKSLGPVPSRVEYSAGHLLWVSNGTLIAKPFSLSKLQFTGEPQAVAQNVKADAGGVASFSTSSDGTLAFHAGVSPGKSRMVWLNRKGQPIGQVGPPGYYDMPALSPDGSRLAVRVTDSDYYSGDLWLWDLGRNLGSRFTLTNTFTLAPAWSPDGTRIAYARAHGPSWDIFVKSSSGASVESLLYSSSENKDVSDWTDDGSILFMVYPLGAAAVNVDIHAITPEGTVRSVVASPEHDVQPVLSPDGNWMAYTVGPSLERSEVYVQGYPQPQSRWRISTDGGSQPFWRRDGRELFYMALDRSLMSVAVEPGTPPKFGLPRELFQTPSPVRVLTRARYAPHPDGQRFLFVLHDAGKLGSTTVVLNWPGRLPNK